jgi:hypothetical protein
MAHVKSHQQKSKRGRAVKHPPQPILHTKAQPHPSKGLSCADVAGAPTRSTPAPNSVCDIQNDLLKVFAKIEHCGQQLKEAFGGQPFVPDLAPHCPTNMTRFQLYFEERCALTKLFFHAVDLWIICCGMDFRED